MPIHELAVVLGVVLVIICLFFFAFFAAGVFFPLAGKLFEAGENLVERMFGR